MVKGLDIVPLNTTDLDLSLLQEPLSGVLPRNVIDLKDTALGAGLQSHLPDFAFISHAPGYGDRNRFPVVKGLKEQMAMLAAVVVEVAGETDVLGAVFLKFLPLALLIPSNRIETMPALGGMQGRLGQACQGYAMAKFGRNIIEDIEHRELADVKTQIGLQDRQVEFGNEKPDEEIGIFQERSQHRSDLFFTINTELVVQR